MTGDDGRLSNFLFLYIHHPRRSFVGHKFYVREGVLWKTYLLIYFVSDVSCLTLASFKIVSHSMDR